MQIALCSAAIPSLSIGSGARPMPPSASAEGERTAPGDRHSRQRLDVLLVERGLLPSRERARALIMAGDVRVNGQRATKPGTMVAPDAHCELVAAAAELRYVSRGGLKLEHALDSFQLDPAGRVALDVGASTGGFTDVLLRRGAARVYAVDVGRGQLAWSLRNDPRVVVMERTNIRHLAALPELVDCAVADVSFISLRLVLPTIARLARPGAWIVALVKPQFEAGRVAANKGGGVIADPEVHRLVLRDLLAWLRSAEGSATGLLPIDVIASPIRGRDGNREYLLYLVRAPDETVAAGEGVDIARINYLVAAAFEDPSVDQATPSTT
jgi:23S rRNA (cytidine1920-2'-O)/16S rRNA (cytidine1409-2'-O)-methyltransferase